MNSSLAIILLSNVLKEQEVGFTNYEYLALHARSARRTQHAIAAVSIIRAA